MGLRVYNTLSGQKEEFKPRRAGQVGMYVCGITAYDDCHLGHARAAVVFDVIRRYLGYKGFEVTYVRNFTDIDDKIIQRSQKENRPCSAIARQFIEAYQRDMQQLGVEPANIEPKATEHIDDIINLVQGLIDRDYAYEVEGDVYFAVRKFAEYGKLSGRNLEELQAGTRIEVDERKADPLDFAVWKSSKPGEPSWESPWGPGRPGWHIECSAMSMHYLGNSFDIHGGGKDLIFPHHENEIAQSEAYSGQPFVKYWLHNGFVNINQEKMSKSLGNFFTVKDILAKYKPEVVRFFLLSSHYRSPIDFSDKSLDEAKTELQNFENAFRRVDNLRGEGQDVELETAIERCQQGFEAAMDDDFNTQAAKGVLFELLKRVNLAVSQPSLSVKALQAAIAKIKELGRVLGLFEGEELTLSVGLGMPVEAELVCPEEKLVRSLSDLLLNLYEGDQCVVDQIKAKDLESLGENRDKWKKLLNHYMELTIKKRTIARQNKDWVTADQIRQRLGELGVQLEDTPQGTTWHFKS